MTGIPTHLVEVFEGLKTDLIWLNARWQVYRQLYGTNALRIDLLNETAGLFFNQLQMILLQDVTLGISRMTDPTKSRVKGEENLVLLQLLEGLDAGSHGAVRARLEQQLKVIEGHCKPFRDRRNKLIAHRDKACAVDPLGNALPGISRQMVEDALAAINTFMNIFEIHFTDSERGYGFLFSLQDGEALIWALKQAAEYRDLEEQGIVSRDRMAMSRYRDA